MSGSRSAVIVGQLLELETVLCRQAKKHQTAVMPGYTHLQRAQPITFAHHLMAYADMFRRDVTRLEDCLEPAGRVSPGIRRPGGHHLSHRPVGRRHRPWASPQPTGNSLDGVIDRDYCAGAV